MSMFAFARAARPGAVLLLALCAGCGSLIKQRTPPTQYYQLDYAAPAPGAAAETLPAVLLVRPFRINAAYDRDSITYRDDAWRAGFYSYMQWIASPAEMVTAKIVRDLQASGAFAGVLAAGAVQQPDFAVIGTVEELGERRADTGTFGAVTLQVTLLRERRRVTRTEGGDSQPAIVFQRSYAAQHPCEAATPASIAAAISAALQEVSAQLQADVIAAARGAQH